MTDIILGYDAFHKSRLPGRVARAGGTYWCHNVPFRRGRCRLGLRVRSRRAERRRRDYSGQPHPNGDAHARPHTRKHQFFAGRYPRYPEASYALYGRLCICRRHWPSRFTRKSSRTDRYAVKRGASDVPVSSGFPQPARSCSGVARPRGRFGLWQGPWSRCQQHRWVRNDSELSASIRKRRAGVHWVSAGRPA